VDRRIAYASLALFVSFLFSFIETMLLSIRRYYI
jgi:hypothetical protein